MATVEVNNLSKTYGDLVAVDALSFSVGHGELFGVIGPDGAGKTSLFRMLTTLLLPDGGSAVVDGFDVVRDYAAIRRRVGYMPGRFSLYQDLTVEENLNFFAALFGTTVEKNYHLIRDIYVQIEPFRKRRAGKLSGGMKQKLALSCALIHKPTVLFLDEPTTGVDAVSRKEFWEMLNCLREQGITILVSTPYMDEATRCDRIALMQAGNLLTVDTPEDIIRMYPERLYAVRSADMFRLLVDLKDYPATQSIYAFGEYAHLSFAEDLPDNPARVSQYLAGRNHQEIEVTSITPTIEDCFIRLLKRHA